MRSEFFGRTLVEHGLQFVLLAFVVVSLSCGASRQTTTPQGEEVDLDELLGEEDQMTASNLEAEEAEVLRLLGITPAEQQSKPQPEMTSTSQPDPGILESQVNDLQEELGAKDREISQLRAELTQKESRISDLEMRMKDAGRRPQVRPGKSGEPSPEFKARYQTALESFNARDYQQALTEFRDLLMADPNNSLSDNCQYWIGESYYGLRNFNQAIVEFEKVFSFPNSNKTDDAQLKLGLCYLKLGDKAQAQAEFERLLSNYPSSEYAALAERYLARF